MKGSAGYHRTLGGAIVWMGMASENRSKLTENPSFWSSRIPVGGSGATGSMPPRFDLLQSLVDQLLVVFPGEVPLDDLRGNHHRQIDRLAADLLERPARLELNLALGVLDDIVGLGACPGADLLAQPVAVRPALRDDRLRFDARAVEDLRRLAVEPLQLLPRLLRIVQRLADRVLPRLERLQERRPGELRQQRQQHQEGDDGPDEEPRVGLD